MWWRRLRYLLLLVALCAIATCPAAKRSCTAKIRAREADQLLGYLADRVAARAQTTGRVPATPAGPTPQPGCCERGGTCAPDPSAWTSPGWRELGFSIDGDHRYTYQYLPDPSGLSATLRATGDLDCSGQPSEVQVVLTITARSGAGTLSRVWTRRP
jgi:hypothetical protein